MRFAQDMDGAIMTYVKPKDCVPLILDRGEYRGGVEKMKRIFRGMMADGTFTGRSNISAGVDAPLVVLITETYRPFLVKALRHKGFTEEEVQTELGDDKVWYGVVDGNFRLSAIRELMEEEPQISASFNCSVLLLKTTPPVERLKQMQRTHETTRRTENSIEATLYDEFKRMYDV